MALIYRISCINKTNRSNPHERIHSVGGIHSDGAEWRLTQQEVVALIDGLRAEFYVLVSGRHVNVVTAEGPSGLRYIHTVADTQLSNNLLSLPECK